MPSIHRPALRRAALFAVTALSLALSACTTKSETEQLAAMRDSLAYTQYRQLSESGLPTGLSAYRKGLQWSDEQWSGQGIAAGLPKGDFSSDDICLTHVLLAYGALTTDKRSIALAESDIVDALPCNSFNRAAAASLRAVVFQREEWPELARLETEKAWALPKQAGEDLPPVEHVLVLHVALAYFAASEQEWERAQVHFQALAELMRQPWLAQVPQAGLAFKEGRTRDGLIVLKKLSLDPSVPNEVRKELGKFIVHVEAKGGDVDSMLFMPRLVAVVTWETINSEGPQLLRTSTAFVEKQAAWEELGASVKDGTGKAKATASQWWNQAREALVSPDKAAPSDAGNDAGGDGGTGAATEAKPASSP